MITSEAYKLSFTGASLSIRESARLAELYLQLRDWGAVKAKVKAENLLQARTRSSVQRVFQELAPRLQLLSDELLEILVEGSYPEQQQLLWFAICRRYAYIREFAVEVIYEKYLRLDYQLAEADYEAFFHHKADWHPELDQLSNSTRTKLRTVIFRMAREAGILSKDHAILPTLLSDRLAREFAAAGPQALSIFPTTL